MPTSLEMLKLGNSSLGNVALVIPRRQTLWTPTHKSSHGNNQPTFPSPRGLGVLSQPPGVLQTLLQASRGPSSSSPSARIPCPERPQLPCARRIHFDCSRFGSDGHNAQLGVKGQGAGLVGEAMLHHLEEKGEERIVLEAHQSRRWWMGLLSKTGRPRKRRSFSKNGFQLDRSQISHPQTSFPVKEISQLQNHTRQEALLLCAKPASDC